MPSHDEWETGLDLNRTVMGGCLRECDGEVLNVGNKTRLAEIFFSFFLPDTSLESFWKPFSLSASEEHRGGVRKTTRGGLTLSRPPLHFVGGEDTARWLTDGPLCISKWLHLFVPWPAWKKMLLFFAGALYERLPVICVITKQPQNGIMVLFCFCFHLLSEWKPQTSSSLEH